MNWAKNYWDWKNGSGNNFRRCIVVAVTGSSKELSDTLTAAKILYKLFDTEFLFIILVRLKQNNKYDSKRNTSGNCNNQRKEKS
jgi:hypothetical protein